MSYKLFARLAAFALTVSSALAGPAIIPITPNSGAKTFEPTDIIQVVGSVANTTGYNLAVLTITFADGTVIENRFGQTNIATGDVNLRSVSNNPFNGMTMTGVKSLAITSGTGAVIVKVLSQAAEFVSEPVMLPVVDDGKYAISLETSVDMVNWAPAAPGDYLGSTSHRFFRVKAEKKDGPQPE